MKKNLFYLMAFLPLGLMGQLTNKKEVRPFTGKPVKSLSLADAKSTPGSYCVPTFVDCGDGDMITNVTIGSINNSTTCSTNGYGDYTNLSTAVQPGQTVPVSVTVGSGFFEKVSIWVDWNRNEKFDPSERMTEPANGLGGGTASGAALTGTIAVPASASPGAYRMRVMAEATGEANNAPSNPCLENHYGEVEDYTLVVPSAGCLTATAGQWPFGNFQPTCDGNVNNITTAAYLNEYSKVSVTAGTSYTFTTSNPSFHITIGNEAGTTVLAVGIGSVTYTPTASGVVRFYSHLTGSCDGSENSHTRTVRCSKQGPAVTNCSDFAVKTNTIENGDFFGGAKAQRLAADLPVGSSSLTAYGIELNTGGKATMFNVTFMSDDAGKPGARVATRTGTVRNETAVGNKFGYNFYKYTVEFDAPITFDPDTKYWMEVQTDAIAWQAANTATLGSKDAFMNADTNGKWERGATDFVFNLVCASLGVNNQDAAKISYYPNPVKDVLTISSASKVQSAVVFNTAGQKMAVTAKVSDNKIDLSKLGSGLYIVNVTLANGQKETFKIVKQ